MSRISSWCNTIIFALLCISLSFTPLFFLVSNEEIFEFNKMLLTYLIAILVSTVWIAKSILDKKVTFTRTGLDRWIILFFLSQLISTALSIHPRTSLFGYYTRFHGGLFSTISYIIFFYATVTFVSKKQLHALIGSILLGAFLSALYAFPEHFGHSPSCVILTGAFDASCWLQDVQSRVFGTFGQPNWLAAYMILLLPLTYAMTQYPKKRYQLVGYLLSALFFCVLLFTQSRSGFLGIVLGSVIFFGLSVVFFKQMKNTSALAALLILIMITFGTTFTPKLIDLFKKNQPLAQPAPQQAAPADRLEAGGTDSGEIRQIVWQGAIKVWQRYPVFGSGVETFAYSYYKDRPAAHNNVSEWDFLYNKAHNELLNFLATTGIVGLSTYLLFQGAVALSLLKKTLQSKDKETQLLGAAVLSGLAALHVSNFFGFSTVMVTILMYVLPGLVLIQSQEQHTSERFSAFTQPQWLHFKTSSTAQWLGVALASMLGVYVLFQVFSIWLADRSFAAAKQAYQNNDLQTALLKIKNSIELSPKEALYYDLYSKIAAQYAIAAINDNQLDLSNQFGASAIEASNTALTLNPVHLNFYKSRNQVLVLLAQVQPEFYDSALKTLRAAENLSPTDAKLVYFEGVVLNAQEKNEEAKAALKRAIDLKPNYDSARFLYGKILEDQKDYPGATEQYTYILEKINPTNEIVQARLEAIATLSAKPKN